MDSHIQTKWTPGPWRIIEMRGGWTIEGPNNGYGDRVCVSENDIHDSSYYNSRPESNANAKLIAAAPDLFEALKELLVYANEHLSEFDVDGDECVIESEHDLCPKCRPIGCIQLKIREARAALRKAGME